MKAGKNKLRFVQIVHFDTVERKKDPQLLKTLYIYRS